MVARAWPGSANSMVPKWSLPGCGKRLERDSVRSQDESSREKPGGIKMGEGSPGHNGRRYSDIPCDATSVSPRVPPYQTTPVGTVIEAGFEANTPGQLDRSVQKNGSTWLCADYVYPVVVEENKTRG
ncbi:hypothetical protein K0M31_003455 [Melipona bicolor]|uniref:Uncharacterized protein n=1 Tax=Melipona bicolor TaxID=60889 RepID=A0AA40KPJ9_9HYME|nr:hypothetical protein K0M31_003455 [Melipona bicolor]